MDLIQPTSGSAEIFGKDSRRDSLELKKVIGYLPGELMQFPSVTAGYILNLLLNLRGVSDRTLLHTLAERLQLELDRNFQDLSHGNKQKVGLVQAMMHKPKLLILDEPTRGLDYSAKELLIKQLIARSESGAAVLIATHDVELVAELATRIVILADGDLVADGPTVEVLLASPAFAPQVTKVMSPRRWLTVGDVLKALE